MVFRTNVEQQLIPTPPPTYIPISQHFSLQGFMKSTYQTSMCVRMYGDRRAAGNGSDETTSRLFRPHSRKVSLLPTSLKFTQGRGAGLVSCVSGFLSTSDVYRFVSGRNTRTYPLWYRRLALQNMFGLLHFLSRWSLCYWCRQLQSSFPNSF